MNMDDDPYMIHIFMNIYDDMMVIGYASTYVICCDSCDGAYRDGM